MGVLIKKHPVLTAAGLECLRLRQIRQMGIFNDQIVGITTTTATNNNNPNDTQDKCITLAAISCEECSLPTCPYDNCCYLRFTCGRALLCLPSLALSIWWVLASVKRAPHCRVISTITLQTSVSEPAGARKTASPIVEGVACHILLPDGLLPAWVQLPDPSS